jgi:ATP-dependent Clp protease ATP-binding subunit ClpB
LGREELHKIVDLQLNRLKKQLAESKFDLEVTPVAKDLLVQEGYDPVYGARPLKRVIQQRLQNALANEILSGRFAEGSKIIVDVKDGDFFFVSRAP